jgi:hypothetical protein
MRCARCAVGYAVAVIALVLGIAPGVAGAAAPTVAVTGIAPGATVSGDVWLSASAWDDGGVRQLKWYVDGDEVGWDGSSPWGVTWDSAAVSDGSHTLMAKAADAWNVWGTSAVVTFKVANDVGATDTSEARVTWPTSGATLSGTVNLTASAPSGATQMKWYVDGSEVAWDGGASWQASWNSASVSDGTHTMTARAMLSDGRWVGSAPVSFAVRNGGGAVTSPPADSRWRLLVSDDFNGTSLDTTKWVVYGPNWPGHAGNGLRDGRAVSVGNGMLTITAQMLNGVLVSGGVKSRIDRTYGRYEFRVRTDADPSAATSGCVLTWPTSENWPAEGENNIYETTTASRYPFSSFIHYSWQNKQYWFHHYEDGTQWHTMAMEWEPSQIRIYRDGALVFTVNDTYAIPDWSHHVVMQLDALKSWMSGAVRLQVDYMRIWERAW